MKNECGGGGVYASLFIVHYSLFIITHGRGVRLDFHRGCVLVWRGLGRKRAWSAVGMGGKGVIMNGKRAEGTEKDAVCLLFDPPAPYAARGFDFPPWRRYMQSGGTGEGGHGRLGLGCGGDKGGDKKTAGRFHLEGRKRPGGLLI